MQTAMRYLAAFKILIGVVVAACVMLVFLLQEPGTVTTVNPSSSLNKTSEENCLSNIHFRRNMASRLLKVAKDIRSGNINVALSEIQRAVEILDRRFYHSIHIDPMLEHGWIAEPLRAKQPRVDRIDPRAEPYRIPSVKFNMTNLNQINMKYILQSNSSSEISSLVTVLVDNCQEVAGVSTTENARRIVGQIREQWPDLKIIVGAEQAKLKELHDIQNGNDVVVVNAACDPWNRAPIEPFLRHVSSAYVLHLVSPWAVTADLNITRLLKVVAGTKRVGVVGIAERGLDAGWDYSCLQVRRHIAHLSIIDGYEYSDAACIFCDVTSSSFLAATDVLRTFQLDSSLPITARQIDWALRLYESDILTMTCPDIMLHTSNKVMSSVEQRLSVSDSFKAEKENTAQQNNQIFLIKELYIKLAQRYELSSISFPNRTFVEYTCSEIQYNCRARLKVNNFLLPPCCLKVKNDYLKKMNYFLKKSLMPFTISHGSVLAAVKFKNHIPWDFDFDIEYKNSQFEFLQSNKEKLKLMGFSYIHDIISIKNGLKEHHYLYLPTREGFLCDAIGVQPLKGELSKDEIRSIQDNIPCLQYGFFVTSIKQFLQNSNNITSHILSLTKGQTGMYPSILESKCFLFSFVRLGEVWVPAPINPGLHALEEFGDYLYKHIPHWRFRPDSNEEVWPHCPINNHPMCLNVHPVDGTIPFLQKTWL